eukprot:Sspe_Gene.62162::Locus_34740_Transcript_1_1_Confidence_1.000_Length_1469::g.62162::m.62162
MGKDISCLGSAVVVGVEHGDDQRGEVRGVPRLCKIGSEHGVKVGLYSIAEHHTEVRRADTFGRRSIHNAPESPHINLNPVVLTPALRSQKGCCARASRAVQSLDVTREPKVCNNRSVVVCDEDVFGFEVPMDEGRRAVVEVVQQRAQLLCNKEQPLLGRVPRVAQDVHLQVATGMVRHHNANVPWTLQVDVSVVFIITSTVNPLGRCVRGLIPTHEGLKYLNHVRMPLQGANHLELLHCLFLGNVVGALHILHCKQPTVGLALHQVHHSVGPRAQLLHHLVPMRRRDVLARSPPSEGAEGKQQYEEDAADAPPRNVLPRGEEGL